MRPRLSMSTVVAVISTLVILLAGCAGSKGTTLVPGSTNSPNRTISGIVTYVGNIKPTHQIIIVALRAGEQTPTYSTVISKLGSYTINNVADSTYTIFAFMDLGDDMGSPQPNEPSGYYDVNGAGKSTEVIMESGVGLTGIDITLLDPK